MFETALTLIAVATIAALLGLLPGITPRSRALPQDSRLHARLHAPRIGDDYDAWLVRAKNSGEGCHCQLLGSMADGTQVLRAVVNATGARVDEGLLFLRLGTDVSTLADGSRGRRTSVRGCGCYALADAKGARIAVLAHRVEIGATHDRPAVIALALEP